MLIIRNFPSAFWQTAVDHGVTEVNIIGASALSSCTVRVPSSKPPLDSRDYGDASVADCFRDGSALRIALSGYADEIGRGFTIPFEGRDRRHHSDRQASRSSATVKPAKCRRGEWRWARRSSVDAGERTDLCSLPVLYADYSAIRARPGRRFDGWFLTGDLVRRAMRTAISFCFAQEGHHPPPLARTSPAPGARPGGRRASGGARSGGDPGAGRTRRG